MNKPLALPNLTRAIQFPMYPDTEAWALRVLTAYLKDAGILPDTKGARK